MPFDALSFFGEYGLVHGEVVLVAGDLVVRKVELWAEGWFVEDFAFESPVFHVSFHGVGNRPAPQAVQRHYFLRSDRQFVLVVHG